MRTTLTLEPDVLSLIKGEMRKQQKTMKEVVNAALRESLTPGGRRPPREPYRVEPHHGRLLGHDPIGFNRLTDELEDAATLAGLRRR